MAISSTEIDFLARDPMDLVGEGYRRCELDRSIDGIDDLFADYLGWRLSPVHQASRVAAETGKLVAVELGPGTGNMLRTIGELAIEASDCTAEDISLIGLNRRDYSAESMEQATVQACESGWINYLIGDASEGSQLTDNSADIVYSFFAMMKSRNPISWLRTMVRVAKPGAYIYFNTSKDQSLPDSPLLRRVVDLQKMGYGASSVYVNANVNMNGSLGVIGTSLCVMQKPYIDGATDKLIAEPIGRSTKDQFLRVVLAGQDSSEYLI